MTARVRFVRVPLASGVHAWVLEAGDGDAALGVLTATSDGAAEVIRVILLASGLLDPDLDGDRNGPDPAR